MRFSPSLRNPAHVLIMLCFTAMALAAVGAWSYGISWDEKALFMLGRMTYRYLFFGEPYPTDPGIRFHGSSFELLLYAAHKMLGLQYAKAIFYLRHLLTFASFVGGAAALWWAATFVVRDRWLALLPALMLLLSPRQVGHAFVNARDIPSLSLFVLSMAALLWFLEHPSTRRAALVGASTGLLLSVRMSGIFVPLIFGITLLPLLFSAIRAQDRDAGRVLLLYIGSYGLAAFVTVVAAWPLLWASPIAHFWAAFDNMLTSQQAPGGFYLGQRYDYAPWHWIPLFLLITTPIAYTVFFIVGLVSESHALRHPMRFLREQPHRAVPILWFFLPVLLSILLKADLFDEWRHMYFVYPAFLLLATMGVSVVWHLPRPDWGNRGLQFIRLPLVLLLVTTFLTSSIWIVRNHPLQYVYFSIPSRYVYGNFELDYWGISFALGYRYITSIDDSDLIPVFPTASPGWENLNALTPEQRRRITLKPPELSKYILDNFRSTDYQQTYPESDLIHVIRVSGMPVLGIYRNPAWVPGLLDESDRLEPYKIQLWFQEHSELLKN